jgi:hypothetical protein
MGRSTVTVSLDLARPIVVGKLQEWFAFGKGLAAEDATKLELLATQLLDQAAHFATLKMQGDAGADGAIAELAQSLQTVSMTLGLRNMTAAREKMLKDVREIVGWLIVLGKSVVVAAL